MLVTCESSGRRSACPALGDGVALVALVLRAEGLAGSGMGSGISIRAALFICLWAPLVVLAGHVGLLVDRPETRGLLILDGPGRRRRRARLRRLAHRPAPRPRGGHARRLQRPRPPRGGVGARSGDVRGVVRGLREVLAPLWLVFGFMLVTYLVGGVGHGEERHLPDADPRRRALRPSRTGVRAWNGPSERRRARSSPRRFGGVLVGCAGRDRCQARRRPVGGCAWSLGLLVLAASRAAVRLGGSPAPVRSAPREHRHARLDTRPQRGASAAGERARRGSGSVGRSA